MARKTLVIKKNEKLPRSVDVDAAYVLQVGRPGDTSFGYCEPAETKAETSDCDRCPKCLGALSMLRWLPPHRVVVRRPSRTGDFLTGVFDFVVTGSVLTRIQDRGLTGIQAVWPLEVVRTKSRLPSLYGIEVRRTVSRIDYQQSAAKWWKSPTDDYCRVCGPGGGGLGGTVEQWHGTFFEDIRIPETDFYKPFNQNGTVYLSSRSADWLKSSRFSNVQAILAAEYRPDLFRIGST